MEFVIVFITESFLTYVNEFKNNRCFQHRSYCSSSSTVCNRSISSNQSTSFRVRRLPQGLRLPPLRLRLPPLRLRLPSLPPLLLEQPSFFDQDDNRLAQEINNATGFNCLSYIDRL